MIELTGTGFELVVVAILGLLLGSFLNVVIHRVPNGESIVWPGSRCPSCGAPIPWFHNIPVVSFMLLRGRCAACRGRIAMRYPLVEALASLLLVGLYLRLGPSVAWLVLAPYSLALVALFAIDLELQLLPFAITYKGIVAGLVLAPFNPRLHESARQLARLLDLELDPRIPLPALLVAAAGAALGYGLLRGIAALYERMTGNSGLGGGDPPFAAMIGAFSGPSGLLVVLVVASLGGTVLGLGMIAVRRATMKTALPFGCFLAPAALLVAVVGAEPLWRGWNGLVQQWLLGLEPLP